MPITRCDHCGWHYMPNAQQPAQPRVQTQERAKTVCPRCGYRPRPSHRNLQLSWAMIIAAFILLLPANIYPITTRTYLGRTSGDTIYSGILTLVNEGMLPIALLVFVASIVIPVGKICGMLLILSSVQFKLEINPLMLTRLYRLIDRIGRWSILDLFVISLMIALMNLGQVTTFVAGPAATAFAAVVLLSVWGTEAFDTRLLWQTKPNKQH